MEKRMAIVKSLNFTSENTNIAADLYLPENHAGKKLPAIILCHGFAAIKELFLPNYAQKFAENGYAVLAFDYRGFGKSGGESGRLVPKLQIEDIKNAITFIAQLPEVDSSKIGLWGTSYGGANAIVTASEDSRVRCLCVQLTFGDGERVITGNMTTEEVAKFKDTIEKMQQRKAATGKEMMMPIHKILTDEQSIKFYHDNVEAFPELNIKIPFLTVAETLKYKPEQHLDKVNAPILIIGASEDGVNPIAESHQLFAKAHDPKELFVVEGATHFEVYSGDYFQQVIAKELAWFDRYLLSKMPQKKSNQ